MNIPGARLRTPPTFLLAIPVIVVLLRNPFGTACKEHPCLLAFVPTGWSSPSRTGKHQRGSAPRRRLGYRHRSAAATVPRRRVLLLPVFRRRRAALPKYCRHRSATAAAPRRRSIIVTGLLLPFPRVSACGWPAQEAKHLVRREEAQPRRTRWFLDVLGGPQAFRGSISCAARTVVSQRWFGAPSRHLARRTCVYWLKNEGLQVLWGVGTFSVAVWKQDARLKLDISAGRRSLSCS